MRLFIAINFNDQIKNKLYEIMLRLKNASSRGNFTRRENFHLTLVFIGETTKINKVKQAMDRISVEPFDLALDEFGNFQRLGGDIYWIGVEQNTNLFAIYSLLCRELNRGGFAIENRNFKPHLTLGREVMLDRNFDKSEFSREIPSITMEVSKISLMKSERINGKLTYTEIYGKELMKK